MSHENNYLDRAKNRLHNGTTNEVARAQAEATLALAHEQRTANLIAIMADGETNGVMPEIDYNEVAKQIKERMGL